MHVTDDLASAAGPWLAGVIQSVVVMEGGCRLGLSGGSTPGGTLLWLAKHLPKGLVPALWITWIDERMTDDATDRNDSLARREWLDAAPDVACMLPMSHTGDLEADRRTFADSFQQDFGGALDVVLLGAGEDGHIASLFPGHPSLDAQGTCVAVTDSPKPPPNRLSLTLPVLEQVGYALLLARGADKAPMLGRAYAGHADTPLGRYAPTGKYHWILDPAAARLIGEQT